MHIETIATELASLLRTALPDADVYPAESGEARDLLAPLARPAVIVTLQKLEALPTALGDCLGVRTAEGIERDLYGKQADVTVGIALYAGSEAECHTLFSAAGQALLFAGGIAVTEFSCGSAEYRIPHEAWRLPAQARFPLLLTREEPTGSIRSFRLHVSDPKGVTP